MPPRKTTPAKRVPASAPKPQDRRPKKTAAAARRAEAEDGFVVVEQCGVELSIPIGEGVSIRALLRTKGLDDDLNPIEGLDPDVAEMLGTKELLGPEQWSTILAANPTAKDFREIGEKIQEATGNQ